MAADNVVPLRSPDRAPERSPDRASDRAPDTGPEPLWRELVGRELRERRLDAGRTLADVAEEAGVSVQYLSEIERGLKEPSSEILCAVHGALGLRLADLTAGVTRRLAPRRIDGPVCLSA